MSTLRTTTLKHGSSAIDNIVFDNQGRSTFGNDALFVNAQNRRVGVNTTSPTVALDVDGQIRGTGNVNFGGQLNLTGNLTVDTDTLFVDSTNNRVGIGTASPVRNLHLYRGTSQAAQCVIEGGSPELWFKDVDESSIVRQITNANGWNIQIGSGSVTSPTWGNVTLTANPNGNIGIGTSSPDEKLHIEGNGVEFKAYNSNSINTTGGTEQIFKLGVTGQRNGLIGNAGSIIFRQANSTWSSASAQFKPTRIEFCTQDATTVDRSEEPRMVVSSNGDIGIGITVPISKFHVRVVDETNFVLREEATALVLSAETNSGRDDNRALMVESSAVIFNANGTERCRLNNTGNLAFANGLGIDFSASAGSGATSSLLDDYEEGSWTPTISTVTGATYSQQVGSYQKIGNRVYFQCYLFVNGGTFTSSSQIEILGLPYTSTGASAAYGGAWKNYGSWHTDISNDDFLYHIRASSDRIGLWQFQNEVAINSTDLVVVGGNRRLILCGSYLTTQ